jgi:hypothetical protein
MTVGRLAPLTKSMKLGRLAPFAEIQRQLFVLVILKTKTKRLVAMYFDSPMDTSEQFSTVTFFHLTTIGSQFPLVHLTYKTQLTNRLLPTLYIAEFMITKGVRGSKN